MSEVDYIDEMLQDDPALAPNGDPEVSNEGITIPD